MRVIVTPEVIEICRSERGGITKRTATMLGQKYPLEHGWLRNLIGKAVDIPDDMIDERQGPQLERFRVYDGRPTATASEPARSINVPPAGAACPTCEAFRLVGLRVEFVDDALQVTSERTGKVFRMSVQALHGLAKRAG